MEDPDAPQPRPFVHWVVYDIPADLTRLRQGLPAVPRLEAPHALLLGSNSYGSVGFYGMKPPDGDDPHHYHCQVFALDRKLDLDPAASRAEVLATMQGHVLAVRELVGQFRHE